VLLINLLFGHIPEIQHPDKTSWDKTSRDETSSGQTARGTKRPWDKNSSGTKHHISGKKNFRGQNVLKKNPSVILKDMIFKILIFKWKRVSANRRLRQFTPLLHSLQGEGGTPLSYWHTGDRDAMTKRPWSLRPRLFKTSLDHYVPSLFFDLITKSLVRYVPCLECAWVLTIFVRYVPWSQRPLDTTIQIFVQNVPWTFWSNFWETKFIHVILVNFALT
jgi:hypothetical protein